MAKNNSDIKLGVTPEEIESELKLLKASYDMYETSKQETETVRKTAVDKDGNRKYTDKSADDTLKLLNTMQKDIIDKYIALGGNPEELKEKKRGRKSTANRKKLLDEILKREKSTAEAEQESGNVMFNKKSKKQETEVEYSYYDRKNNIPDDEFPIFDGSEPQVYDNKPSESLSEPEVDNDREASVDTLKIKKNGIKYDVIPLPSKGECYKNKTKKIPVAYLTAFDEDLIVSPNLYKDGTFLDYMLKMKIMTNEIDPDDLLPGDRDAIILWLRGSSYGPEYPVTATDNETGQRFETVVDLSTLGFKEFKLKGDENGYFTYELPVSKDVVKFKFLSYKDMKSLEKDEENENLRLKKSKITEINNELREFMADDSDIDRKLKVRLNEAFATIDEYANSIDVDDNIAFSHTVTNKMIKSIVSINDITDRKYINEYVMYMSVKDSSELRKYITNNEPGVDFNVTVEKPASLGGGSATFLLALDQFIFLNIA